MNSDTAHFIMETRRRCARYGVLVGTSYQNAQEHMAAVAIDSMLGNLRLACNNNVYDPIACEQSAMAFLRIAGQILGLHDWRRP